MRRSQCIAALVFMLLPFSCLLAGNDTVELLGIAAEGTAPAFVMDLDGELVLVDLAEEGAESGQQESGQAPDHGYVDVFTSLNVRTGPGLEYQRIGGLAPGTPLEIIGERNGWFEIVYGGGRAWVCGYYVWTEGERLRNGALASTVGMQGAAQGAAPAPATAEPAVASQYGADGGLEIPLYNQMNCGAAVPSGFCGPTSLKMALEFIGIKKDINYLGLENIGGATPVYRSGQGAGHQAMLDMVQHCGATGSYMTHGQSISWLREQTQAGNPVVVSVRGNYGPRSTRGHILCVAGVTADGSHVIINDSNGGKRHLCPASTFYSAWSSSSRMAIVVKR